MNIRHNWAVILFGVSVFTLMPSCTGASTVLKPAEFKVNKIEVSPSLVDTSQSIDILAEIGNFGGTSDNYTAILYIDGKERDKKTIAVRPSENKTIAFSIYETNTGSHEVQIGSCKTTFNVDQTTSSLLRDDKEKAKKDGQDVVFQGMPATLRYDYLNTDENPYEQIAVCHIYRDISNKPEKVIGRVDINAPLIILPRKEGSVTIVKSATEEYEYRTLSGTPVIQTDNEKKLLNRPGWGLATTFHPENMPFQIKTIRIACVANYTVGLLNEYENKFIKIQILDGKSDVIWSKFYPWSQFRGNVTWDIEGLPPASWVEISTGGVTVDGDFTIEVSSLGKQYVKRSKGYDYFALAYEEIGKCSSTNTNSFISENGTRSDPWITLYDQYGNPVCFNLCIRVDGIY